MTKRSHVSASRFHHYYLTGFLYLDPPRIEMHTFSNFFMERITTLVRAEDTPRVTGHDLRNAMQDLSIYTGILVESSRILVGGLCCM